MSAAAEIQPLFFDEDGGDDLEIQFEPSQFRAVTPYTEDINDEYQAAQDRLRQLRQQEELVQRQAAELEELSQKEVQFKAGRASISEQLNKYLTILDKEATEAQRLAETCGSAHERLESHLSNIHALRPESWSRADRKAELTRALGYIEAAQEEIENIKPLVNGAGKKNGALRDKLTQSLFGGRAGQSADFLYWLKSGFAFSLPLVGFGLIGMLVMFFL